MSLSRCRTAGRGRITLTLAETPIASRPNAADLPRINARTLSALMQFLMRL